MKKILYGIVVIIIFAAILSVNVFAESEIKWTKGMSEALTEEKDGNETYYSVSGFKYSYSTPYAKIGKIIKENADKESVTLNISFEGRIKYPQGDDPEDVNIDIIFRADGFSEKLADKSNFEDLYEGSFFKLVNNTNIMAYSFKDSKITLNDEWKEISFELELYNEDLGIGLWDEWILCFQNYKPLDGFEALELKNVKVSASDEGNTAAQTEAPVTKAPEQTETPTINTHEATKTPTTDTSKETQRPIITKDPSKTVAPDSAMSSILANSCSCNQLLPIIAIIIAVISAALSVVAIVLSIRKKN